MFEWFAGGLLAVGVLGVIIFIIIALSWLIAYILTSIGLFTAAKKRGLSNYGLAWVPFFRYYLLGTMLNNELAVTPKVRIPYFQFILPAISILGVFSGATGSLFSIVFLILLVLAFIALFRQYKEPNAIVYGLLAGIPVIEALGGVFVCLLGDKPVPSAEADCTVFP